MLGFLKEAIIMDVYVWNVMITTIQQLGADKKQEKIWLNCGQRSGPGRDCGPQFHLSQFHHDWWGDGENVQDILSFFSQNDISSWQDKFVSSVQLFIV